jgi:hypothetical protein
MSIFESFQHVGVEDREEAYTKIMRDDKTVSMAGLKAKLAVRGCGTG